MEIECPICGEEVHSKEIELTESEIPVYKRSHGFGGDVTNLTEQNTKLAEMPCGCNIKTI